VHAGKNNNEICCTNPTSNQKLTSHFIGGYSDYHDYYQCYTKGKPFQDIHSPNGIDNRFLNEDLGTTQSFCEEKHSDLTMTGVSLVFFSSLGKLLGVPTPACDSIIKMGGLLTERDYFKESFRTLDKLGMEGWTVDQIKNFMKTGEFPTQATQSNITSK
jgi:hypothetical protein